jgi:ABC-2 type transport system permease protein
MDSKTFLILRHEFAQTIRRKSFIIMTLAFPLLAVLALVVYRIVSGAAAPVPASETTSVGYVDGVGTFGRHTEQAAVKLIKYENEDLARAAMLDGTVDEYIVIAPNYLDTGAVTRYTREQELEAPEKTVSALYNFLLDNLLEGQNEAIKARAKAPLSLVAIRLDEQGNVASNQGGFGSFIVPYLFSILLVMSIFSSSGFLLQGLGDEKQNRVMEILLSSVSARQLLTGKVLALGAAGLAQMVLWVATIAVVAPMASAMVGGLLSTLHVPSSTLVLGVVYFILGYFLFAVLMAGVGSISTTPQEGQQLATIFTLSGVAPMWASAFIIENPDHVIGVVLTLFPVTAPITVMMRLGLAEIPPWQLVASIAVLLASSVALLLVAAKVFRAFLLMYGKRPGLREIIKAMKEA